jgi:NAD(P)-dependent dehydrogenase (short-subunit alcohol dehydrogenase family)
MQMTPQATGDGSSDVAVVVGAAGAVGAQVVARLTRRGLRVLAVGRRGEELDRLAAVHPGVIGCVADIGDDAAIATIAAAVPGPVRMALFSAGLSVTGSADVIAPDDLARAASIKVAGVLRLLHAVRDRFAEDARFVAIAGSLGFEPGPLDAAPGTANAALANLMRQVSQLYGPRGVTVHTIAPGPLDTPRLRAFAATRAAESGRDEAEVFGDYAAKTSLGRLPTADEVAWLVEMLLAPEAAALHGSVLSPDGGAHRGIH